MSARGFLVAGTRLRPRIVSESKRYIPPFWLSFLTPGDIANAESYGQFKLDREQAIERGLRSIPFFTALFPQVPEFEEIAHALLDAIGAERSRTIGIEIAELLPAREGDSPLNLPLVIGAIEDRDADCSLTIPAQTIDNPFTREFFNAPEQFYGSLHDLLMEFCWMDSDDLASGEREQVEDFLIGYLRR